MAVVYYCDANELLQRYDKRRVAQLIADDGIIPDSGSIASNSNLLAALVDATAEINSAVLIGKRYTVDQLDPLSPTAALTDTGFYLLKRLAADLAFGYLVARRGLSAAETNNLAPRYGLALELIAKLKQGEAIFDTADGSNANAGLAHSLQVGMDAMFINNSIVRSALPYYGIIPAVTYPVG